MQGGQKKMVAPINVLAFINSDIIAGNKMEASKRDMAMQFAVVL